MKRTLKFGPLCALMLALVLCLSACAAQPAVLTEASATVTEANALAAVANTPAPTPVPSTTDATETVLPAATITGTIEGTVVDVEANDIVINMANGNTISFMMNYITDTEAHTGDKVTIEYSGDVTDRPEAITITVTEAVLRQCISGEVLIHSKESVFVQITSQEIYGFVLTADTKVIGLADAIAMGDLVTVDYEGDLHGTPVATQIEITTAVKDRKETPVEVDNLSNKVLEGQVSRLSNKAVSIRSAKGKTYTFKRNNSTKVSGNYTLEVGARISVTYDGYAGKSPAAKSIYVIAPKDPTPTSTPTRSKTASGTVTGFGGMYLQLSSGIGFDCAYATYGGNSSGNEGDSAKVTYYVGDDGMNYATRVIFNAPQPAPKPSKTTSGTVSSFGGMYLQLDNGIGFDCAYASISGNGSRVPGETAKVTYYVGDDGMNYATRIVFTAVEAPRSEFETNPSLGEPDPEYGWEEEFTNEPSYYEPEPQYSEPEPQYSEPEPQYSEPEPQYSEPTGDGWDILPGAVG